MIVAVVVVAVVLVGALLWVTFQGDDATIASETDPAPSEDVTESAPPAPPGDGTYQIHQADDECLRISGSGDGYERQVLARGACDGDAALLTLTTGTDGTVTIGFGLPDLAGSCLRVDGPQEGEEAGIDYYGPAECDPADPLQRFTLLPAADGTVRLQSVGEQCMDVYEDYEFTDGKVVATANCSESATQPMRFRPV
ncbi:hypothetical protein GCM10023223_16480 [Stackebrandtia albiflava]